MSSINAIGSQINSQVQFTGSKKNSEKADSAKKQNLSELGGRSFAEKYTKDGKPINMTTANAGILLGDYILEHLIQIGIATATFVALALKGKNIMNGVTGGIVDTTKEMVDKNSNKLGVTKRFSGFIHNTITNIKKTKALRREDADALKKNAEDLMSKNARKSVIKGSIIDRMAEKADNEKSLFSKFVKKVSKNPNAGSEDVRNFFSKKLGWSRGADAVDDVVAITTAGGVSGIVSSCTDAITDLNDEKVAQKAEEANRRYQEADGEEKKAIKKERRAERINRIEKAAETISKIM